MVCSELALAALKELSFGVAVFTAAHTAASTSSLLTAKAEVPLPMEAMARRVFWAPWSVTLNPTVWKVRACLAPCPIPGRSSVMLSHSATLGASAPLQAGLGPQVLV
jgi:hypothetical protein